MVNFPLLLMKIRRREEGTELEKSFVVVKLTLNLFYVRSISSWQNNSIFFSTIHFPEESVFKFIIFKSVGCMLSGQGCQ
jgi:hypothetical protein